MFNGVKRVRVNCGEARLKTKGLGGQMGKGGNGKALQRFSHRQDAKVLYLKVDGFSLLPFPHFPIFAFKRIANGKTTDYRPRAKNQAQVYGE